MNDTRKPSTSKELKVEFSLPNATLFGGALPLLNYVNKLRVTKLFEEALTFFKAPNSYNWEYEWIVTNLMWDREDIWRFYNHRCGMENYIKEAKTGFAIDAIALRLQIYLVEK